jgi:hypothetical protein
VREHVPVQHEELFGEGLGRLASAFGASVLAASEL